VDIDIPDMEIEKIIWDVNEDWKFDNIAYYEFMTAVCKFKGSFSREWLWGIFKQFDVDDSDAITIEDIQQAMKKWEIEVSK
jgi:Ca2+-binding EF-hand superfamily protein